MFRKYLRKNGYGLLKPYVEGEPLPEGCSVSEFDRINGSPKPGDMIAQSRNDPNDTWLASREYFEDNYFTEPVE